MPRVGFETTISELKGTKTFIALIVTAGNYIILLDNALVFLKFHKDSPIRGKALID
jgi:hypothetical protein